MSFSLRNASYKKKCCKGLSLAFILTRNFTQGVVCSGFALYIQGLVIKEKGPVFLTAFNPLSTILVAIIGSFILFETIYLGRCALIFLF